MILFIITITYLIGIIWGLYIKNIASIFFILISLIFIYLLIIKRFDDKKKIKEKLKRNKKKILIIFTVFLISFLNIKVLENSFENKYKNINENVKVKAIVVSNIKEKEYKDIYTVKVESLNDNNKTFKSDLLLLQIKNNKLKLNYGDEIEFIGNFENIQKQKNTGGFDYKQYLKTKKIYGVISLNNIINVRKEKYNKILILINKSKINIESKIEDFLNNDEANLLKGILLGCKENLNLEIEQNFRDSNLSHLLSVSGAHVSYIILAITFTLNLTKLNKKFSKIITIIFLVFFMFLTGATPSVVRACMMSIYIIVGSLFFRKTSTLNSISLALLIIIILNPYKIFDVGSELSFGGTIGILLFNRKIEELINKKSITKQKYIKKILDYVKAIIIVSLSANIFIIPIILYHYNSLSLTFVISNLLVTPLFGVLIILGFILVFTSFISIKISKIISLFVSIFLKLLIQITKITSKLPFSKIYLPTPPLVLLIVYYFILVVIIVKKINIIEEFKNRKIILKKLFINKKFLVVIIIIILLFSIVKILPKNLRINFIDVSQGDCTLIRTPNNKNILIDGGGVEKDSGYDVGKNVVIPYLLDKGITKIDYVIISHFDTDHVGGLLKVMEELKVGQVVISRQKEDSENYKKFKEIIKEKKINVIVAKKGDRLQIEKNLYFDILWPNTSKLISENVLNNNSIVCKLHYKNFSCLFTGDIEEIAEKEILQEYKNNIGVLNSTVLKVAHHGSKTSSTKEFLEVVRPKIALIGVGENNKFGHPNVEVIDRLLSMRS